jgi:hypothetical protein
MSTNETEWFYVENGQQAGPVSEIAARAMIRNGSISPKTLVWRDGMKNWVEARKTELGEFFPAPEAQTDIDSTENSTMPTLPDFTAGSLHTLWMWLTGLTIVTVPLYQLILAKTSQKTAIAAVWVLAIIIAVIAYTLLYRFWSLIQDGNARTTPMKAVLLCLIPFYNIYWNYIAYVGLAEDMNKFCDNHNIPGPRINQNMALIWYMLLLCVMIPQIRDFVSIAVIALQIMLLRQFVRLSGAILDSYQKK